jgi:outer membrane lipoprotein-sorting protein
MTKRPRIALALLAALLFLAALSASGDEPVESAEDTSSAAPPRDTWHATTYVKSSMGLHVIHYWSKRSWMRAQTTLDGHPVVTIVRDGDYIGFDALTGRGVRVRRAPEAVKEDRDRTRPFGNDLAELIAQGADKVEESERSGRAVEIWQKTDGAGRRKLWVTSDEPRLPMRLEVFVRAGSETITTDYADWTKGLKIPDSFFEAPSNVTLETLDYPAYMEASAVRRVGPVLYPELLHGSKHR